MHDESAQPATKADVSLLKGDISLLKGDITLLKTELKAELATKTEITAVKTEITAVKTELIAQISRVAAALVNTQADVQRIEQSMATKKDVDRILSAIDAFAKKSENHDKAVALHGHVLTEIQVDLKDHESRLKTLESAHP